MNPEENKDKEEKREKSPEKEKEEKKEEAENQQRVHSNVDMILPPCELETIFAKNILMPSNPLPSSITSSIISPFEMELTELKVKVACLEKTSAALKLELKCAELQVEAKDRVDKQKTRLIELLDHKVQSLESKNNRLIEMVEGLIEEKQSRSNRLLDATKSMETLTSKLENSARVQQELRHNNEELKKMLNNMQNKGSQIAKLAKEKLVKYKDENERMQGELDDYKQSAEVLSADFAPEWDMLNDLGSQLQGKLSAAKTSETSESTAEILLSADGLNNEIKNKVANIQTETIATVSKYANANEKLLTQVNNLKQSICDLQKLSDKTLKETATPSLVELAELRDAISNLSAELGTRL
ncbi:hypothetical protein HELRODRAFT_188788 [Helobdella robusta]|uniref:Uncharacterized protein n=1 Tax=Helobdella robusta TaxID=6412 RepID=T1FQD0_HELRO|nr:hypothetical protein HELRODRAFT_188788 [Helobdella robusta]ESO02642.1 hypothetical protein HELRODRAFT_188788 [Helobdella robusta]